MFWPLFGKKKIGLVLSGGVARGIAHIGVLKVIEQYKIPIDFIAATSSGSIAGAAYAAGLETRLIEEIGLRISWGKILRVAFFRPGFVSGEGIKDLIIKYVGDKVFSELKIPLTVVGTDLRNGKPVIINRGRVAKAVAASSAFPGLFAPEEINRRMVIDGGIAENLPVDVVKKMGANYVVASDVIPSGSVHYMPKDPIQVFSRSLDIVLHQLSVRERKKANILIEPMMEEDIWPFDLHKAKALIAAGEAAAHKALRGLRRKYS